MASTFKIPKSIEDVLATYPTAVLHLRQQNKFKRIGITLGAGVSAPLKYPSWDELVGEIATNGNFKRDLLKALPKSSTVTTTQRLFEYYQACLPKEAGESERIHSERVANSWKRILSESLYRNNQGPTKIDNIRSHPYLLDVLPVIAASNLVVNFNFDDSIETALEMQGRHSEIDGKKTRNYESRWDLNAPIRNDIPTIFHLNGFLASRQHEYSSDNLVFAEDSFLKRMTLGKIADDSILLSEYINNTYIHLGLSLRDEVLKALLQRAWKAAPANIHYQIHYVRELSLDDDVQRSILDANFRVLNLFTMFLGDEGTKSLFRLTTMPKEDFVDLARRCGVRQKRTFYVTGSVGSGKTTIVNHFKNLWALDEWLEPSPEVVSRPFDKLTSEEREDADNWVGTQFCKKNLRLLQEQEGIAIVDRSPLDPLTFAESNLAVRAESLRRQISPNMSNYRIEPGVVLALEAEAYELRVRLIRKWKFWSEETIEKLIAAIRKYYSDRAGYIDTKGLPVEDVVRTISRKIFFEPYEPIELDELLDATIEEGKINV